MSRRPRPLRMPGHQGIAKGPIAGGSTAVSVVAVRGEPAGVRRTASGSAASTAWCGVKRSNGGGRVGTASPGCDAKASAAPATPKGQRLSRRRRAPGQRGFLAGTAAEPGRPGSGFSASCSLRHLSREGDRAVTVPLLGLAAPNVRGRQVRVTQNEPHADA